MRIAFYSPMKEPDHPVPSGDRQMARLLMDALGRAGHEVWLASRLRTWSAAPDVGHLTALERASFAEASRLAADWRDGSRPPPDLWLTYHLYHKAPDLIGPQVAADLSIPYVVVEASRAARRQDDAWREHFRRADRALYAADRVVSMSRHDLVGLEEAMPGDRVRLMPPFIDAALFDTAAKDRVPAEPPRLLSAAMMRDGRKADSFRVLADAFRRVTQGQPLALTIAGGGPEQKTVEAMFRNTPTTFLGRLPHDQMPAVYARHDLFVWPAIDEPYGIVFLEAQAAGLPVIGSNARGVPDIVADGVTGLLPPSGDTLGFARALADLVADPERRRAMGSAARAYVARNHDIATAAAWLDRLLAELVPAAGPAPAADAP